jgi:hypothetical protein
VREIQAANFRDGPVNITLQQLYYLITKGGIIYQKAADVG